MKLDAEYVKAREQAWNDYVDSEFSKLQGPSWDSIGAVPAKKPEAPSAMVQYLQASGLPEWLKRFNTHIYNGWNALIQAPDELRQAFDAYKQTAQQLGAGNIPAAVAEAFGSAGHLAQAGMGVTMFPVTPFFAATQAATEQAAGALPNPDKVILSFGDAHFTPRDIASAIGMAIGAPFVHAAIPRAPSVLDTSLPEAEIARLNPKPEIVPEPPPPNIKAMQEAYTSGIETARAITARANELASIKIGKRPLLSMKEAEALVKANPDAPMEELIRKALGQQPEPPPVAPAETGGLEGVLSKLSDQQLQSVREQATAGEPNATVTVETPGGTIEARKGPLLQAVQYVEQTRATKPPEVPSTEPPPPPEPPTAPTAPTEPPKGPAAPVVEPPSTAPAPPAEHLPGFKYLPGGPEGPISKAMASLTAGQDFEFERIVQKRGVRSHDVTQAAADEAVRTKAVTLADILSWEPGTIKNAEHARAGVDIAEAAIRNAAALADAALKGQYDPGAALSAGEIAKQALMNASAVYSEIGRALESAKMTGVPASPIKVADLMGLPPIAGGIDVVVRRLQAISDSAGGPRKALEQMAMMPDKFAEQQLASFRTRFLKSTAEYVYTSLMGIRTAFKIVRSAGVVTPAMDIVTTGVAEGGRRLFNALAPDFVDAAAGVSRGSAFAAYNAYLRAVPDAWRSISTTWQALTKVAKEEGIIKGEQQFTDMLRQDFPQWSKAVESWDLKPHLASDYLPEVPDILRKGLDAVGAVARGTSTDLVSAAHAVTAEINFQLGAAKKANELAVMAGHEPGTLGYDAYVERLMRELPDEVNRAGQETLKRNTFINDLPGWLGGLQRALGSQFGLLKLINFPFTKVPISKLDYVLNYTPGINFLMKSWREDFAAGGARRDMALAKLGIGSLGMTALVAAAQNGLTTGSPPVDNAERLAAENAGKVWGSYWNPLTQKWASAREAEPLGDWITIGADMQRILRDAPEESATDVAFAILAAAGDAFFNQGMMLGVSNWIHVISGTVDSRMEAFQRMIEVPIPMQSNVILAQSYVDQVRKEARGLVDHYLKFVPGYGLPPKRNIVTGEALHIEGATPLDMVSAFATHSATDNPVLIELERLRGARMLPPPDHIGGPAPPEYMNILKLGEVPGVPITPEQRDRWLVLQTEGGRLESALRSEMDRASYKDQSDPMKIMILHRVYSLFQEQAKAKLLREEPALAAGIAGIKQERAIQLAPSGNQPGLRERLLSTLGR